MWNTRFEDSIFAEELRAMLKLNTMRECIQLVIYTMPNPTLKIDFTDPRK